MDTDAIQSAGLDTTIPYAVYDNPTTQMREWWQKGKVIHRCPQERLEALGFPHANRAWSDGKIIGERSAFRV